MANEWNIASREQLNANKDNLPQQFVGQRCASQPSIEAAHKTVVDSLEAFAWLPPDYSECTISFASSAHTFAPVAMMRRFLLLFLVPALGRNVHRTDFRLVALAAAAAFPYVTSPYKHCPRAVCGHQFHIHSDFSSHSRRSLDLYTRKNHSPSVCHSHDQTPTYQKWKSHKYFPIILCRFKIIFTHFTHFNDKTGPTSLKISFSFSSVASYGMLPTNYTEDMTMYSFKRCVIKNVFKYLNFIFTEDRPHGFIHDALIVVFFTHFADYDFIRRQQMYD